MEERYREVLSIDKLFLRRFIEEYIGKITSLKKLDNKYLALYEAKGGIVGVDGSTNRMGGAYPHFVDIFQGLAKSTIINNKAIFKSDLYTPLFSEKENNILAEDEKEIAEQRNKLLANIEVEVALEAVRKYKPYAILMDGSLIRYNIYSYDSWINLRDECENQGVLLVGVIKDIKTSIIGDKLKEVYSNINVEVYDRELLFGQLQYGEMIIINDEVNKKNKEGYSSIFMRSSLQPTVIGMDIIDSQKEYLEEMGRLVFTLTPENSRGVPLWLDIVDKEVQISDAIMKGLMERYMNRDLYERFFVSERAKRN
ncbi:DNA double-strand break repair nuclease NurA [Tissierella pigra]|uniref:DNA double-strand break repair nuclease NurA n=2 Tax=Tissierella pigra TaxID=2607614 RepID=A0A6N7XS17_9FIRM|nr:DNA double-strand break repair nuclease NurA [Tissierella pigra]MBU5427990.1 DNA double-strand break repair nuclease NurA [Tissierella pigra]MSU00557.1 DNA double-strand break repair nuclease NurA [Tissierella pigra]